MQPKSVLSIAIQDTINKDERGTKLILAILVLAFLHPATAKFNYKFWKQLVIGL